MYLLMTDVEHEQVKNNICKIKVSKENQKNRKETSYIYFRLIKHSGGKKTWNYLLEGSYGIHGGERMTKTK